MKISINTVFEEIFSGEAEEVILPGDNGELSIMDFHQSVVCRLATGSIKIVSPRSIRGIPTNVSKGGSSRRSVKSIPIVDGIAHMEGDTLRIMAEVA